MWPKKLYDQQLQEVLNRANDLRARIEQDSVNLPFRSNNRLMGFEIPSGIGLVNSEAAERARARARAQDLGHGEDGQAQSLIMSEDGEYGEHSDQEGIDEDEEADDVDFNYSTFVAWVNGLADVIVSEGRYP
jgi:hypothetical protein